MAGYIMTLDSIESLNYCVETGVYSTNLSEPKNNKWPKHHEGTFSDYLSMRANDNIYFFIKRKIYGIGTIRDIKFDCKFLNFIDADKPEVITDNEYASRLPLLDNHVTKNNRCFCTFVPKPYFFKSGIDMDDVLSSNPSKFRMLRAMWKVSFIKVDDDENQALIDIILKRNEEELVKGKRDIFVFDDSIHKSIGRRLTINYELTSSKILDSCVGKKDEIIHEMAIEAALCEILGSSSETPFGKWDYISHQVVASPFKAVDYMDKMDIFRYRFISGYATKSKYLVIEIKKGIADTTVVEQVMKYVDWIQSEYTFGDYSMIEAYIVALDFPEKVIKKQDKDCTRYFTKGYRPSLACEWSFVKLIKYKYDKEGKQLQFEEI